jgi:hypothetical protein
MTAKKPLVFRSVILSGRVVPKALEFWKLVLWAEVDYDKFLQDGRCRCQKCQETAQAAT